MSNILTKPVAPAAATQYIRSLATPEGHKLDKYLPTREISTFKVGITEATLTENVASYRALDAGVTKMDRPSYTTRELSLMPLGVEGGYGELEKLKLDQLRLQGSAEQPFIDAVYDDLTRGVEAVRNRLELARGELLSTGKIVISENGLVDVTADFNVPASNFPTAADAWSDVENAKVLEELSGWVQAYRNLNGFDPAGMIISRKTLGYLQRNYEIRASAGLDIAGRVKILGLSDIQNTLSNFALPPIVEVYDTIIKGQRVLPENQVIFTTPQASYLGETIFGPSSATAALAASDAVNMSINDSPGLIGLVIQEPDFPFQEKVIVDGMALPILNNAKALFAAEVF